MGQGPEQKFGRFRPAYQIKKAAGQVVSPGSQMGGIHDGRSRCQGAKQTAEALKSCL
jgi:hypothetical protein